MDKYRIYLISITFSVLIVATFIGLIELYFYSTSDKRRHTGCCGFGPRYLCPGEDVLCICEEHDPHVDLKLEDVEVCCGNGYEESSDFDYHGIDINTEFFPEIDIGIDLSVEIGNPERQLNPHANYTHDD